MIIIKKSHIQNTLNNNECQKELLALYPDVISILHTPNFHILHTSNDYTLTQTPSNNDPNVLTDTLQLTKKFKSDLEVELLKTNVPEKKLLEDWIKKHDFK